MRKGDWADEATPPKKVEAEIEKQMADTPHAVENASPADAIPAEIEADFTLDAPTPPAEIPADMVAYMPSEPQAEEEPDMTVVSKSASEVAGGYQIARFRGRAMVMIDEPYPHYVPLHKEMFDKLAYPILGGVSRSRMQDVFAYLCNTTQDLSDYENYILFGLSLADGTMHPELTGYDAYFPSNHKQIIWDTRALTWVYGEDPNLAVYRSPYPRVRLKVDNKDTSDYDESPLEFIMQLAGGDEGLYDDIMQSLAPMVMEKKPDGVIWWVGDGANGKSTLMDALYKIFPGQLSSLTVKRLTDGRDTPSLNGTLANIVKESSEGRIEDTEIYKSIGTHENFRVHKFHSQDDIEIRGNIHHIFSANTVPTFNDKGYSARRRTFIIPFGERFESDPTFEERTFTPEFFGRLINEMCRYAIKLRKQGYRYKWSAKTLAAKANYDAEASNAEEYGKQIISEGVVAFEDFAPVKMDYENWCATMGFVPLGISNLRRALNAVGFERRSVKEGDFVNKRYILPNIKPGELMSFSMGRPGLFTTSGFEREVEEPEEEEAQQSIVKDLGL